MRCIICDRCGKIIQDPKQMRVVTCARPIRKPVCGEANGVVYRGNDRQLNDILWEAELCGECVIDLESFMEKSAGGEDTPDPSGPEDPTEPDPTDPTTPPDSVEDGGNEETV